MSEDVTIRALIGSKCHTLVADHGPLCCHKNGMALPMYKNNFFDVKNFIFFFELFLNKFLSNTFMNES